MNTSLFIAAFFALSLFYIFLSFVASKGIKGREDFYLASRDLGFFGLCSTLVATQLGGGALLGTANQAYVSGFSGIYYNLGMVTGFIIMGLGIAGKWRELNVTTVSEIYSRKYNSEGLKFAAGLFSIFSLFGGLVAQVVASKSILVALGVSNQAVFIGFWALVIVYTIIGGLKAVVITDKIQVGLIFFGFIAVAGYIAAQVDMNALNTFVFNKEAFPKSNQSFNITSLLIVPVMFALIQQDLGQRMFSARTPGIAKKSAIVAGVILFFFSCIPVFIGAGARFLNLEVPEGASALIVVLNSFLSPSVMAIVMCAVLAAIISTADSLLCAICSNVDVDLKLNNIFKMQEVTFSRVLTCVVGVIALVLGNYFKDILGVLLMSFELPVAALFVTIMIALFKKDVSRVGAITSVCGGVIGFVIFMIYPVQAFPSIFATLSLSLSGYLLGILFESSKSEIKA